MSNLKSKIGKHFENFNEAKTALGTKKSKKACYETELYLSDGGYVVLKHHYTGIIVWRDNGWIKLNNGGYMSKTTKFRLNMFLPIGVSVYQKDYEWYLRHNYSTMIIKNSRYFKDMQIVPAGTDVKFSNDMEFYILPE